MYEDFNNEKLKQLFKDKRISPKFVSEYCNVSHTTMRLILNGTTTNPKIDTLKTLAKYFDLKVEDII